MEASSKKKRNTRQTIRGKTAAEKHHRNTDIAIIGISCRVPSADNYQDYWRNLVQGINSIQEMPATRWDTELHYSPDIHAANKSVSKWVGLLEGADRFDNRFFNIMPREASNMDPQQRLLLEETWHCIEDSGVSLRTLQEKKTSVFMGIMTGDYRQEVTAQGVETDSYSCLGNFEAFVANRISYEFGLNGKSLPINASCASSLVAIHEARQSLRSGESEYALAGGVSLNLHPWKYISFSKLKMLSPDGQCKTFDKDANGYVPGDGVGVLLLQRLEDAIRDGNHIYGIVRGTSVNHSGHGRSITAPQVEAQRSVILEAYRDADVSPETVSYVEAMATGSSLGDPIEIESLTQAFRMHTDQKQYCKIGSVKPNIGHLEAASGVVGIIKLLLMTKHRKIPRLLNLQTVNPMLDFANSPFSIATDLTEWSNPKHDMPLRAGINSFGFSGVNSHVVIEEYLGGQAKANEQQELDALFVLSAHTPDSLTKLLEAWRVFASSEEFMQHSLHDICRTLLHGREHFAHRTGKRVRSRAELNAFLENADLHSTKKNGQEWELRVGSLMWQGYTDVQQMFNHAFPIKSALDRGLEQLAKLLPEQDVVHRFQAATWLETERPLFAFLVGHAYIAALQEVGFTPSLIGGGLTGIWVSLVASGIVKFEDALAVLSGVREAEQVKFARPAVAFQDPVSQQIFQPVHFDAAYVQKLTSDIDFESLMVPYLEKARLLIDRQFTFKKLIAEWNGIFKRVTGHEIEALLQQEERTVLHDERFAKVRKLLVIVILSTLHKLNERWGLQENESLTSAHLLELVQLVADEVMSRDALVELLIADQLDAAGIAENLNKRQSRMNPIHSYLKIHKQNEHLHEIADKATWLAECADTETAFAAEPPRLLLVLGEVQQATPQESRVCAQEFQETLLKLWLKGVAINWEQMYSAGTYQKVALPCCSFERHAFRLLSTQGTNNDELGGTCMEVHKKTQETIANGVGQVDRHAVAQGVIQVLLDLLTGITGFMREELDETTDLRKYGLDSVSLSDYCTLINARFGAQLNSALLFQYTTVQEIASYLAESEPNLQVEVSAVAPEAAIGSITEEADVATVLQASTLKTVDRPLAASQQSRKDVAIIGLSGRFPGSKNTREFWEHLVENHDLITEVPADRWEWQTYFGEPHGPENKTRSKWGGFLEDIKSFDASFFKIAPKEAELMDPQQRIMLEEVWHVIEDAGYQASSLSGTNTGVFLGVFNSDYNELLLKHEVRLNAYTSTGTAFSIIPNRISYQLNLHGPSLAIETACSGSLVAIHQAVQAIQLGDCEMAFAGGVNINISPRQHISFDNAGMLSVDGRCKTFDASANGYVRGEGAGVLFLKDLTKAQEDGDYVYGVIKGSAVNHGGYANSLTAPNPNAQADLIVTAMERAQITPDTVSYIEAHGTGTRLGDPIEINGLKKAFADLAQKQGKTSLAEGYCGIGSAKTNIGHLESAAGIAGVIKVLLAMKHQTLVGNLHLQEINPYVQLEGTPFSILRKNQTWQRLQDEKGLEIPRRAGVSSFGFGGTNAHVVIEEFENNSVSKALLLSKEPRLFVLSARNNERLKDYAKEMHDYLIRYVINGREVVSLSDVAYTLQKGREAMEERLAILAASAEELAEKLLAYSQSDSSAHTYKGSVTKDRQTSGLLLDGEEGVEFVRSVLRKRRLDKIAQLWVMGVKIDWDLLYGAEEPRRIPLPGYPFEKRHFWFDSYKSGTETKVETGRSTLAMQTQVPFMSPTTPPLAVEYHGDEVVLKIIDNQIALVIMQDREQRNMFSTNIIAGLTAKFAEIKRNESIKAVIVTGYDNVFCMGGTQEELENISDRKIKFTDMGFMYRGLLECDVPVIAAIQGHAMGGGLTFGLFADFVVMSEESIYSANFMKYGFTPGMGSTFVLKEKLGNSLATEMMFTAKSFSGEELKKRGASLLFKPQRDVLHEAFSIAKMLTEKPRYALQVLKKELSERVLAQLPLIIESELDMHDQTFSHPEVKKRIQQHFNKAEREVASPAAVSKPAPAPALEPTPASNNTNRKIALKPVGQQVEEQRVPLSERKSPAKIKLGNPVAVQEVQQVQESSSIWSDEDMSARITHIVGEILHLQQDEIRLDANFKELGVDSISGVEVVRDLNKMFGLNLEAGVIYDFTNINSLTAHLQEQLASSRQTYGVLDDIRPSARSIQPLAAPVPQQEVVAVTTDSSILDVTVMQEKVAVIVGEILHLQRDEIGLEANFKDLGVDSISGVEMVRNVNQSFGLSLEAGVIYDFTNISTLTAHVIQELAHDLQTFQALQEISGQQRESAASTDVINLLKRLKEERMDLDEVDQYLEELL